MAFKYGTASDLQDLYESLVDFLTGAAESDDPVYVGTGNGTLDDFRCLPGSPTETWTLTATSSTNFTVTGSVSGAQAAATVGTPYANAFITFTLTAGGTAFVSSDEFTIDVVESPLETAGQAWVQVGEYLATDTPVYNLQSGSTLTIPTHFAKPGLAVKETWTITVISATEATVSGTVSGAQANLFQNTTYDNGIISLFSSTGTWVPGDIVTIEVVHYGTALKGLGLSGTDEIHINLRPFLDPGNGRYSINFRGALGYDAGSTMAAQPNTTAEVILPTWNGSTPYWFYANGRRFIPVWQASTVYLSGYFGWILPFGLPAEHPLPLYVAGGTAYNTVAYDSGNSDLRGFFDPAYNAAFLNLPGNTWLPIYNYSSSGSPTDYVALVNNVWPWGPRNTSFMFGNMREGIDGASRMPIQGVIHGSGVGGGSYGALDGVFFVQGFNGVSPEDTYVDGGDTYRIFNNVFRLETDDFVAIKEE